MSSYSFFAGYYDTLTQNVGYRKRADYLEQLLESVHHEPGIVLDLACGTGSLTLELKQRGWDIYGVDASPEMLSAAMEKAEKAGASILFLCQKMQSIDLYGTVDTVICTLDSINHLTMKKDVQAAFDRVSLFLNPGGYFIFDVNTLYKHEKVLGNNTFIYDTQDVYCVWQNAYDPKLHKVNISLDFFERDGKTYYRRQETFFERAYSQVELAGMLAKAGLELVAVYGDLSLMNPAQTEERAVYLVRKA